MPWSSACLPMLQLSGADGRCRPRHRRLAHETDRTERNHRQAFRTDDASGSARHRGRAAFGRRPRRSIGLRRRHGLSRRRGRLAAACRQAARPRRLLLRRRPVPRPTKRPSPARSSAAKARIFTRPKRNARPRRICSGPAKPTRFANGQILGESVNLTRHLVNEPPHDMYPESFAEKAEKVAKACGLQIEIWDEPRLEARAVRFAAGGGPRFVSPAAAGDSSLQRRGEGCAAAGVGRQGRDVRLRRPVAQTARRHAHDEVRHGRRGHGARSDASRGRS